MTMHEITALLLCWGAGVALGALFFGGLWWTLRKSLNSPRLALWLPASALVRTGITLSGFYAVLISGDWRSLLVCVAGFVMARMVIMRLLRPVAIGQAEPVAGVQHAP